MIMDFSELKKIVNENIIDKLDHSNLNEYFPTPTAEYMVVWIANILEEILPGLVRVRLYETRTSYCEWKR